jgi:hypothetical protein
VAPDVVSDKGCERRRSWHRNKEFFENQSLKLVVKLNLLDQRKLQLLPSVLMRRQNEEAKAGAFAYKAGEFCWLNLPRSQISICERAD